MTAELTEKWRLAAADWLDLQDAADMLTSTKGDVFAEIVDRQFGNTTAEKERKARLSIDWKDHVAKILDAESKARRAKFRVQYAKMKREDQLNADSNARAERKQY